MPIENTKRIEEVELGDDDERYPCGYCDVGMLSGAMAVNHYINAHGFRLLAVAPQSHWASDGRQVWNKIVAVLGHDNPPTQIRQEALVVELENLMEEPGPDSPQLSAGGSVRTPGNGGEGATRGS